MSEKGEGFSFNESLSKSFKLADSFRKSGVFGEKSGEEALKANQKVTEILNSSFQVGFESEGQYNNISQYESVVRMIEISKPEGGRTPRAQENAKNALFEVGLALSQNKEILKAATEGSDQLNKIIPSKLHEIQPYILSVILTNGKNDVQGQELVSELVDLFKLKNRADKNPSVYKDDYSEAYKKLTIKLDDIYDDLDSKSRIDGTEGRIETMRGYVFDINEENKNEAVVNMGRNKPSRHNDKYGPERIDYPPNEPIGFDGDEGGGIDGRERRGGFSYGPELPEFALAVIESRDTDYRESSPPVWLKEKDDGEKYWYRMADAMARGAGNKTALKDSIKGLEKLWFDDNVRLKINEADFEVMYKNKGFRLATKKILEDICVLKKDVVNGDSGEYLYIKRDDGDASKEVLRCIYDLDKYKEELSMLVCKTRVYGDQDFEVSFRSEIDRLMSINRVNEKQAIKLWREEHNFSDAQIEAGTAWNFLYNCNFLESADFYRDLVPTDAARGDTVNFVFHPEAKVNSKLKEIKISQGKEEVKGGPLADWFLYQLEHNSEFRKEYDMGKHRLFPKRLCPGFLDAYPVTTIDGKKMSMAEALFKGETIDCNQFRFYEQSGIKQPASKLNMFKDYKDSLEGALTTFKYLTGEVSLDGKNTQQWAIGIKNGMSLLRQQEKNIPGRKMSELDKPEIYAAIICASFGVDRTNNLLTVKKVFPDYKAGLQMVTLQDFIKSSNSDENISKSEWKHTPFQKRVFDFVYKNAMTRTLNEFRK